MKIYRREVLGGLWELVPVERFDGRYDWNRALTQDVPSHWQQHTKLAGYAGKVVYRRRFDWSPTGGARTRLTLPGVFYWSTVRLNGVTLGAHEGYFEPQVYDVTDALAASNELVVEVDCPDDKDKHEKTLITGVYSHWDCLDPTTNPGGIWLAPYLAESGPARVVGNLIHTEGFDAAGARQVERLTIRAAHAMRLRVRTTYQPTTFDGAPHVFEETVEAPKGESTLERRRTIPEPRKWWTHDLGRPDLYRVSVEITDESGAPSDSWSADVGLRTARFVDWVFHLNGERLYLKGSNIPPTDTRIATASVETMRRDVELAIGANMNMQRVHAHIDRPEFYNECDRAGLLLWQDMPLQWQYHRDKADEIQRQARALARLLYNHPSVACWCCHNEPFYVVDTKEENPLTLARTVFSMAVYSWNRDVLDARTKRTFEEIDPSRMAVRSSGELPLPGKGTDLHFYGGWYRQMGTHRAFDRLLRVFPKAARFATEFGAQSFPNLENAAKFMDADLSRIDWKQLQDRNSLQIELMDHWTPREGFRDLGAYIQATQDYQSFIQRHYIDRLRARKYAPNGGLLSFMFNDPNPAIQWSVVDYWRTPKSSYFSLRDQLRPVYAMALLERDETRRGDALRAELYAVNDLRRSVNARVEAVWVDDEGRELFRGEFPAALAADGPALRLGAIEARAHVSGRAVLTLTLHGEGEPFVNRYEVRVR